MIKHTITKLVAALAVVGLLFAVAACDRNSNNDPGDTTGFRTEAGVQVKLTVSDDCDDATTVTLQVYGGTTSNPVTVKIYNDRSSIPAFEQTFTSDSAVFISEQFEIWNVVSTPGPDFGWQPNYCIDPD